jgi:hypothetical protein
VGAAALPPRGRALSYTYSNIREEPPPRPHTGQQAGLSRLCALFPRRLVKPTPRHPLPSMDLKASLEGLPEVVRELNEPQLATDLEAVRGRLDDTLATERTMRELGAPTDAIAADIGEIKRACSSSLSAGSARMRARVDEARSTRAALVGQIGAQGLAQLDGQIAELAAAQERCSAALALFGLPPPRATAAPPCPAPAERPVPPPDLMSPPPPPPPGLWAPPPPPLAEHRIRALAGGLQLRVCEQSIETTTCHAVVNAANPQSFTQWDQGVSGALRDACRPEAVAVCQQPKRYQDEHGHELTSTTVPKTFAGLQPTAGWLRSRGCHW